MSCSWCNHDCGELPALTSPRFGIEFCSLKCARAQMLKGYQREVGRWARENFGDDQPHYYPLVGIVEEVGELTSLYTGGGKFGAVLDMSTAVGELAHSTLKQAQGIRLDEDSVGLPAEKAATVKLHRAMNRFARADDYGEPDGPNGEHFAVADAIGDTTVYMCDYLERSPLNYTLGDAIEIAWDNEVSQREWDADVHSPE